MITAGIDCGVRNTKTVVLKDGKAIGAGMAPTGFDADGAVDGSLAAALRRAGLGRREIGPVFATGSGRNAVRDVDGVASEIEAMARALDVSVEEMGALGSISEREVRIHAQCAIFAESEVIGLIHSNVPRADISRAVFDCIAGRIAAIIRRVGVQGDVALIGGPARSPGLLACLRRQLKVQQVLAPPEAEFGAAAGAAICAAGGLA